jgi:hypothetical protein
MVAYILLVLIVNRLLIQLLFLVERVEVSDGKLHKLKQNIFDSLFTLKVVLYLSPISSVAVTHEI